MCRCVLQETCKHRDAGDNRQPLTSHTEADLAINHLLCFFDRQTINKHHNLIIEPTRWPFVMNDASTYALCCVKVVELG